MAHPVISGLYIYSDIIGVEREEQTLAYIDAQPWSTELSRRTQHYGYQYNYTSRNLKEQEAPPLSGPLLELAQWLSENNLMTPQQLIVNEYTRNQGIAAHIDKDVFGDTVIGFSLGADCIMVFTRGHERVEVFLPRRSLMVMTGDARYQWKHEIPKRVTYIHPQGQKVTKPQDYRRISLTYRRLACE